MANEGAGRAEGDAKDDNQSLYVTAEEHGQEAENREHRQTEASKQRVQRFGSLPLPTLELVAKPGILRGQGR